MALEKEVLPGTSINPVTAYLKCVLLALDFQMRVGRIVVQAFESKAASDAERTPIATLDVALPRNPSPAKAADGTPLTLTDGKWLDSKGEERGVAEPPYPGFEVMINDNPLFDTAKGAVYTYIKSLPQFQGAKDV